MARKPRKKEYTIKAYYYDKEERHVFWCKEKKIRNISNEFGASLPLANGESMIETNARLDFKQNKKVEIAGEILKINMVDSIVDPSDRNSRRGSQSYITTMVIK